MTDARHVLTFIHKGERLFFQVFSSGEIKLFRYAKSVYVPLNYCMQTFETKIFVADF